MSPACTIQGVDVFVDGDGATTLVMLHGWPDDLRLWDGTVQALQGRFRCVRFTLPGFDLAKPPGALPLDQMTGLIDSIVNAVSPNAPVTLLLHDWGCMFGYAFAAAHPARVSAVVAVDVGDHNSQEYLKGLGTKAGFMIFAYQFALALAWEVGRRLSPALANRMTRWIAHFIGCRTVPAHIGWQMNYPYAMTWFGTAGGLKGVTKVKPVWPLLYIYGARKPFMFHSAQWLELIKQAPGSAVHAFATGHWVMVQKPDEFNACVHAWLTVRSRDVTAQRHPPT